MTVGVAAVLLAGCSAAQPSTAPPDPPSDAIRTAPPPDGLSASLVQYRRDQAPRLVEVKLANAGTSPLDITLQEVTLPGFTGSGAVDHTTDLKADRRVDLPVPLGDPLCDEAPDGTAMAQVEIDDGSGGITRTAVPVDDDGLLTRLHTFDCALRQADDVTDITVEPTWEQRGEGADITVAGEITIALTDPSRTVEIVDIVGNLLFVMIPETVAPPMPVRLDEETPKVRIAYELLPSRCDGHAIAEAKRLTTVAVLMSVDGQETVPIRRPPDDVGFDTLVGALNARCAAL